ncbi:hypothetical protein F5883DRAFT_475369 [Diaporthe sp. PMI_573]|nr:hypothetical protein F5883DRAFT_475369 [Diaporthaceae sp. PMI_573]
MPNFRRKSCHQCRSSKLACDQRQPRCSRCERRRFQCRYSPLAYKSRTIVANQHEGCEATPVLTPQPVAEAGASNISDLPLTSIMGAHELGHEASDLFRCTDTGGIEWFTESCDTGTNALRSCDKPPDMAATSLTSTDVSPDFVADFITDINTQISTRNNIEYPILADHSLLLRPRQSKTLDACLLSKIMIGTICNYPEMLVDGLQLPPFISPPCCGDEPRCHEPRCHEPRCHEPRCHKSGFHQCLPESLTVCATIIRMTQANGPKDKSFLWRTIYTEQQRLLHEHEFYDTETLVAAVQAATLYTILHIADVASVPKHYLTSLTITLAVGPSWLYAA